MTKDSERQSTRCKCFQNNGSYWTCTTQRSLLSYLTKYQTQCEVAEDIIWGPTRVKVPPKELVCQSAVKYALLFSIFNEYLGRHPDLALCSHIRRACRTDYSRRKSRWVDGCMYPSTNWSLRAQDWWLAAIQLMFQKRISNRCAMRLFLKRPFRSGISGLPSSAFDTEIFLKKYRLANNLNKIQLFWKVNVK